MKKRSLAALLCIVLAALTIPLISFAADKIDITPSRGSNIPNASAIRAGEPRAYSKFSGQPVFVEKANADVTVPGKCVFKDAYAVEKKVGTFDRTVIFVPNDSNKYNTYEFTVTLTVNPNPYPEIHNIYAFGKDPETDKPLYWICTKVYDNKVKLISLKGFDELSDKIVEGFFSDEEKEDIRVEHAAESVYTTEPALADEIFKSGSKKLTIKSEDGEKEELEFTADGKRPVILVSRYSKLLNLIEERYAF